MSNNLQKKAEELASRKYTVIVEEDQISDVKRVFLARTPELPGCKAYGLTDSDAKKKLAEVRVEYIYSLLEDRINVPDPMPIVTVTEGRGEDFLVRNNIVVDEVSENSGIPGNIDQPDRNKLLEVTIIS